MTFPMVETPPAAAIVPEDLAKIAAAQLQAAATDVHFSFCTDFPGWLAAEERAAVQKENNLRKSAFTRSEGAGTGKPVFRPIAPTSRFRWLLTRNLAAETGINGIHLVVICANPSTGLKLGPYTPSGGGDYQTARFFNLVKQAQWQALSDQPIGRITMVAAMPLVTPATSVLRDLWLCLPEPVQQRVTAANLDIIRQVLQFGDGNPAATMVHLAWGKRNFWRNDLYDQLEEMLLHEFPDLPVTGMVVADTDPYPATVREWSPRRLYQPNSFVPFMKHHQQLKQLVAQLAQPES